MISHTSNSGAFLHIPNTQESSIVFSDPNKGEYRCAEMDPYPFLGSTLRPISKGGAMSRARKMKPRLLQVIDLV